MSLNPQAREFVFNPNASTWSPPASFAPAAATVPAPVPEPTPVPPAAPGKTTIISLQRIFLYFL